MLYASELSGCQKKDCQMDFQAMDYVELLKLKEQLDAEIKHRESEEKLKARKQILDLAKTYGLELSDLLSKGGTAVRKPAEAKYRHPDDANVTWSGLGRKPHWVEKWLAEGKSLEDLAI